MAEIKTVKHLVIAPDGSRRYARDRNISLSESYDLAARKGAEVVKWCFEDNLVDELSFYVLDEHNLKRDEDQLVPLLDGIVLGTALICDSPIVKERGLQVKLVGEMDDFFEHYNRGREELDKALDSVASHIGKRVNILAPYDGCKELERARQRCLEYEECITPYNLSKRWSMPPVTLYVRTAQPDGFVRLSTYLPGIEQAMLISTPTYPQDLTKREFYQIVDSFFSLKGSSTG